MSPSTMAIFVHWFETTNARGCCLQHRRRTEHAQWLWFCDTVERVSTFIFDILIAPVGAGQQVTRWGNYSSNRYLSYSDIHAAI